MAWTRPAPQTATRSITDRYPVKTLSSIDVHLAQITRQIEQTSDPDDTAKLISLFQDRTALLELRHEMACPLCGR